jgi:hypothetical protein
LSFGSNYWKNFLLFFPVTGIALSYISYAVSDSYHQSEEHDVYQMPCGNFNDTVAYFFSEILATIQ